MSTDTSPAISIIMPVYKAEAYLRRSICSLLAQTFGDFELLLIDDGSPDRSGEICDEFARKDPRVRVVHQANGGVAAARQCGLDHARGEYVIHADPDDWAEPDMLEELYGKAKRDNADIVICDYYINKGNKQYYKSQQPKEADAAIVLWQILFQQLHGSCWNKLVSRDCYRENSIKFPKNADCWEDLYINCCILMHAPRVSYLNKAFYHYDTSSNTNSLVRNYSPRSLQSQMYVIQLLEQQLNEKIDDEAFFRMKASTKERAFLTTDFTPPRQKSAMRKSTKNI